MDSKRIQHLSHSKVELIGLSPATLDSFSLRARVEYDKDSNEYPKDATLPVVNAQLQRLSAFCKLTDFLIAFSKQRKNVDTPKHESRMRF